MENYVKTIDRDAVSVETTFVKAHFTVIFHKFLYVRYRKEEYFKITVY